MKKWISCILVMVVTISIFGTLPANAENGSLEPNSQMETNISVQGTNSFGNLLTNELTAEMDKQEENNGCNIFSIEMNGTNATVSFETTENCTLVIAVYDESGEQMLASGNTAVVKGETEVLVTIDTDSMPQYYYLRGFLVDSDTLRPVCTVYESPNYTQEMQAFFAKTVNDFDSEKVLNLDESESNNFAVFSNETIIIEQNGTTNRVTKADDSTRTYVIANAGNTVKSLKNGDVFTCKNGDETLIVKVDNISVSGSTVTISGQDTSMEEVFDYVKIDVDQDDGNLSIDNSTMADGVKYEGVVGKEELQQFYSSPAENNVNINKRAVNIEVSSTTSLKYSVDIPPKNIDEPESSSKWKVSGDITFSVSPKVKLYISLEYQYLELKFDYKSTINVSLAGKKNCKIELGIIGFSPVPGIFIEVHPSFVAEFNANISIYGTLSGTVGFSVSPQKGIKSLTTKPNFATEIKVEGTVFLGFSLEPKIKILDDRITKASISAKVGAECKSSYSPCTEQQDAMKHDCNLCIKGEINGIYSVNFEAVFANMKSMTFKKNMLNVKLKLFDFYYSFDYEEGGFTTCPHKKYKVNIVVKNKDDSLAGDAKIKIDTTPSLTEAKTDENGNAVLYLPDGEYIVQAIKDSESGSRKFIVDGAPKKVTTLFGSHNNLPNTVDGLVFEYFDTFAEVVGYTGEPVNVVIPATVNGYPVTSVKAGVFENCKSIKKVKFPDTIQIVSESLFENCTSLENVLLPKYLEVIDEKAFLGCNNLTEIIIPESVRQIEQRAFQESGLKNVTLSKNMSVVNSYTFWSCSDLTDVTIPKGIEIIYDSAFYFTGIKEIYLPSTVTEVQSYAFGLSVEKVSLPNGIKISNMSFVNYGGWLPKDITYDYYTPFISDSTEFMNTSYLLQQQDEKSLNSKIKFQNFTSLFSNKIYNFYVMKSETAESPLSSDNLLYITQAVSDANGNLEIPYIAKEQYENAVTFVKAASKTDLSSAQVTIPDILCNGAEQFAKPEVTLNEETLTEGVDYDIEKRYSAIYPGEYELIITGIRNYTGEVSATYNIYCEHNFADNKCTICKSFKDTVGDANGDGVVGIADLVVLQSFLLAKRNDISINADINQDGVINGLDLCMLRRIILDALN